MNGSRTVSAAVSPSFQRCRSEAQASSTLSRISPAYSTPRLSPTPSGAGPPLRPGPPARRLCPSEGDAREGREVGASDRHRLPAFRNALDPPWPGPARPRPPPRRIRRLTEPLVHVRDLFDLTGKVAIVTGGSRGLGFQMATALGEAGAALTLTARTLDALEAAAVRLRDRGFRALAVVCNVTRADEVEQAVARTLGEYG